MRLFGFKGDGRSTPEPPAAPDAAEVPATHQAVLSSAKGSLDEIAAVTDLASLQVRAQFERLEKARGTQGSQSNHEAQFERCMERLLGIIEGLDQEVVELRTTLERVWEELDLEAGEVPEESGAPTAQTTPAANSGREPESEDAGEAPARNVRRVKATSSPSNSDVPKGVRVLATQMATAGSTEQEIESRLRSEFGVSDPSPVLDELFGEPPD